MEIKVCGMKYSENIDGLSSLSVDYIGHIFYEKSPRNIPEGFELNTSFPNKKVGVFVNAELQFIESKIDAYKLDVVQLHGDESPEFCHKVKEIGVEVFKAFGLDEDFNFNNLKVYQDYVKYFVFDTKTENKGGSGQKFNWQILDKYNLGTPFLLSGGISQKDVNQIKDFKHDKCVGIDLNSGFEISPGLKNIEVLSDFIKKINS